MIRYNEGCIKCIDPHNLSIIYFHSLKIQEIVYL